MAGYFINIKRKTLARTLVACLIFLAVTSYAALPDSCAMLFDANGIATNPLAELLELTKANISEPKSIKRIAESIEIKNWRTHSGKERWCYQLPEHLKNSATKIIAIGENKLDMKTKILPKKNVKYSGILFLGATLNSVINRVEFYKQLINAGVVDKKLKIWVLTGERKLDEKAGETDDTFRKLIPNGEKNVSFPTNELEMIKFVFHYLMPKDLEIEYIDSKKDQGVGRATTLSTTIAWAEKMPVTPQATYYLGISNQPVVTYQEMVINLTLKKINRKDIAVHVIGNEMLPVKVKKPDNYAAILLDTIAKTVDLCYQWDQLEINSK